MRVATAVLCTAWAVQGACAQAPVVESYGTAGQRYGAATDASAGGAAAPSGQVTELFQQLQAMQVEMQELRGLVEEQGHQLKRLAQEQKEQYLDIDRRLMALGGQAGTAGGTSSNGESAAPVSAVRPGGATTERDAYTRAFDLTREKRFPEAIDGFNQLVVDFPNGPYTPNAFYWLGELYLALPEPDLEKSRQSFTQVVTMYPTHQKVPDALYKLGVVYDRMGEQDQARTYFTRVQSEYGDSPAARLARSYAAELR